MTDKLEELRQRNKELEGRVAKLEAKLEPPKPFVSAPHQPINPIDRLSMPKAVQAEFANAVKSDVVRDIVRDLRRGPPQLSSMAAPPSVPVERAKRTNGWQEGRPLEPPPGIKLIDAMLDQQARVDRAERMAKARMEKS